MTTLDVAHDSARFRAGVTDDDAPRERGWGRVDTVAPAVIATPVNENTAHEVQSASPDSSRGAGPAARRRWPNWSPFPASDRVSFSTGAVYDISGGRAAC
ncbi:hypothetical protein ACKI1I_24825 [Streptomyces turgidiscabies]|uniref:Uncharacterized protein n=1 Tax=Streptomyces turgidiscabies (strain Car8) TaxID=698760 RepID=L7ESQ6_STRT8|nr:MULTISPECIES: hypothetical protein [Streptomyces]ELP62032.1 hypothetical protein STRTUCAR8_00494 [Streptomyces turgidiscabies Car8]MDX3498974.1 hypothetical protein [Streptomyces turgidiscabies]GAQ73421.1 hypothetical protein T45_05179 [Streptomyces turgidiscabies]